MVNSHLKHMEELYWKMESIRGTRYAIELTKRVQGMPGFAPEYRDIKVCEVVFKFPHGDGKTYVQFEENPPNLDKEDIEQILEVIDREFDESKFDYKIIK
jgi:hypothetical protein